MYDHLEAAETPEEREKILQEWYNTKLKRAEKKEEMWMNTVTPLEKFFDLVEKLHRLITAKKISTRGNPR